MLNSVLILLPYVIALYMFKWLKWYILPAVSRSVTVSVYRLARVCGCMPAELVECVGMYGIKKTPRLSRVFLVLLWVAIIRYCILDTCHTA